MIACSSCGTQNPSGSLFCNRCGVRLDVCPACGASNVPEALFCNKCGTRLPGIPSDRSPASALTVAQPPQPLAERRLVTVLFADLVGFTPFAEERDPEEVRETLSRYFELARDVVERYAGTIEKFIGDAVMAVWGAPSAREDDAERAVRAALDLVEAVRSRGAPMQVRAGVLSGEAAVTLGAIGQGLVAGDVVNTASRLQAVAPAGGVLVGEATMRAASRAIAFESVGDQVLRGRTSPMPAWLALRVVAERGGRNRSETLEAPLVGRGEELRVLKEQFHATGSERRARLVSVIGPPGIGKTRLAWEFAKYADGLAEATYWHMGRSPAYGDGITFWALGEMVRGRCGLAEDDDESETRAKVAETVARWVPDEDERSWVEPALLALLGVERMPGGSEQLFGAWRTFFERIAAAGTVSMIFEDLHYADSGLLAFIDHVLGLSRGYPIYVVTLARPELLERRPDWQAKHSFTSVHLDPLPEPAMRELLAGLVPGLPETAVHAIVTRADGVPLYAVETVRMLVADGRLVVDDGVYRPTGDLTRLAVPDTLTALIASRLDALDAADRALIQDGAVLGHSFTTGALAAVAGKPAAELEHRLQALVRREILTLQADPRSPERGQYSFVQSLTREVAYNTLARADRKVRHLAAARFFEALDSDELAGALAGQYLAAYANAPEGAEADALSTQARLALRAAAERAVTLGSHEQAVAFLRQALAVTHEEAEEADLLERAGASASASAHHDEAEAFLTRAVDLRRHGGGRKATARATALLGDALLTGRQNERALSILQAASLEFSDLASDPAVVHIHSQLARAYMLREKNELAIEIVDHVLDAAEHADLGPLLADALVTKGTALNASGRTREGMAVIEAGEHLATAHGWASTALRGLNNRLAAPWAIDPQTGVEGSRTGLDTARRIGDRTWIFNFREKLGQALWLTGEWDEALAVASAGLDEDPEPGDRLPLLNALIRARSVRGEPVAEMLAELVRSAEQVTDPQMLWTAVEAPAFVAFAEGRLVDAGELWRQGARRFRLKAHEWLYRAAETGLRLADQAAARADLAAFDALGLHGPLIEVWRGSIEAGLTALAGRHREAATLYDATLTGFRRLGIPLGEALAALDMAVLLDPAGPDVRAAAASARAALIRLRATPLLTILEAALADQAPERALARAMDAGRTPIV